MQIPAALALVSVACLALASGARPAVAAGPVGSVTNPAVAAAPGTSADMAGAAPQDIIAGLSSRLFASLDALKPRARNADSVLPIIDRLLAPYFDAEYTARQVLGPHWNPASAEQRQRFASAFYQRLLRTYAGAVAGWTADRIRQLPLHSDPEALQVSVRTMIRNSGEADTAVDYRLHRTAAGWKVFDVLVDGVSYLRSYRDDIDADVARNGIDAATARLERHYVGSAAQQPAQRRRTR